MLGGGKLPDTKVPRNTVATLQGRSAEGHFAVGNRGGPGRPSRATEAKYLKAMISVVTVEDWVEIAERAVADAKGGNWRAREWLSQYLIGKPTQVIQEVDQRSVQFDLGTLSDEQLGVLLRIAQPLLDRGGASGEESE